MPCQLEEAEKGKLRFTFSNSFDFVFALIHRLPYSEFFGGVSGLTVEQFRKINGFPNAFWGWGGEDDDLWNRWVGALLGAVGFIPM